MNIFSIYKLADGIFTGGSIMCNPDQLLTNIPFDSSCVVGNWDHLAEKVDLETGFVIDYIPEQPSENHSWNILTKRWDYNKTTEDLSKEARLKRDELIALTDWMVIREIESNVQVTVEWSQYRQALRDVTDQFSFPETVAWPTPPLE